MVDFTLSGEQWELQKTGRRFARDRITPVAAAVAAHGLAAAGSKLRALYAGGVELGFTRLLIPEAAGGGGMGCIDAAILFEELGAADHYLIMARTTPGRAQMESVSMFLVDAGTPGFSVSPRTELIGWHTTHHGELIPGRCARSRRPPAGEGGQGPADLRRGAGDGDLSGRLFCGPRAPGLRVCTGLRAGEKKPGTAYYRAPVGGPEAGGYGGGCGDRPAAGLGRGRRRR